MKTKKLPSIFSRSLWLLLMVSFMLPATGLRAEEPELPVSATDNMVLRLDASAISGLDHNAPVINWLDLSGKNNHAEADAENAPVFNIGAFSGRQSVKFLGSNLLKVPHQQSLDLEEMTILVVFQNDQNFSDDFSTIASKEKGGSPHENRNWWMAVQKSGGNLWFRSSSNKNIANDLQDSQNYKDGQGRLVSVVVSESDGSKLFADGIEKDSNDDYSKPDIQDTPVKIGAAGDVTNTRFFSGDIAEIIFYDRALTDIERQEAEDYLTNKWLTIDEDAPKYSITTIFNTNQGSISPSGEVEVSEGDNIGFAIEAFFPYYAIEDVVVNDESVGAVSSYTFLNVDKNNTIKALFQLREPDFTITATSEGGGSISPSGDVGVYMLENKTFQIIPEGNNGIVDVKVNGISVGPLSSYTFTNVMSDHSIHAEFGITGPVVHLDASVIDFNNGDKVDVWTDLSQYENNAYHDDDEQRPEFVINGMNNKPVVRFDGVSSNLRIDNHASHNMGQLTVFAVFRNNPPEEEYDEDAIGVITSKERSSTNRNWWLSLNYNFKAGGAEAGIDPGALWFRTSSGSVANNLYNNGDYANGSAHMVSVVVPPVEDGNESKMYIDGEQKAKITSSTADFNENQPFRIGASVSGSTLQRFFGGDLAELIFYNRALSDEERIEIEDGLKLKWFNIPKVNQWPTASDITFGDKLSEALLSEGDATVEGDFEFVNPDEIPDAAGPFEAEVVFIPIGENNEGVPFQPAYKKIIVTVNPKSLIITANDVGKTYGEEDPDFSVSYDGFVLGQNEDILNGELSFTREVGENAG